MYIHMNSSLEEYFQSFAGKKLLKVTVSIIYRWFHAIASKVIKRFKVLSSYIGWYSGDQSVVCIQGQGSPLEAQTSGVERQGLVLGGVSQVLLLLTSSLQ